MTSPPEAARPATAARNRVDLLISQLGAAHNRVVTWAQLRAAGVDDRSVRHRVAVGRLHRRHRGVYLLDPLPMASRLTLFTAAVDACGADALLSHFAAAELWGLMRRQNGPIDVTVVGRNPGTKGDGVRVHRTIRLDSRDVRTIQGVRVTSPARTLLDLAALVPDEQLEDLIAQARVQRLVTERAIHVVSDVYKTRPGAGRLRALTERELGTGYTRSRAERLLVKLIRQAQLPIPRTNVRLHGLEVDALWPEYRLVVEVDSFRFHGDRAAFERDRARDAKLVAAGYRVIRVTWRQLTEQPLTVVARIARALGAPEPAPS